MGYSPGLNNREWIETIIKNVGGIIVTILPV